MQPPAAAAAAAAAPPSSIKVTIRSCKGNGRCLFFLAAPANVSIGDVKQQLCRPPHSMCSDASTLVLVLKGKGAAVACALQLQPCDFVYVVRV